MKVTMLALLVLCILWSIILCNVLLYNVSDKFAVFKWTTSNKLDQIPRKSPYKCNGWRHVAHCSTDIENADIRNPELDLPCSEQIPHQIMSGYCEIEHNVTAGQILKVMNMNCGSLSRDVVVTCEVATSFYAFQSLSENFEFHAQSLPQTLGQPLSPGGMLATVPPIKQDKGIVVCVNRDCLASVYAGVRSLRDMGCSLPVELWFIDGEIPINDPVLQVLVNDYSSFLRVANKSENFVKYAIKPFAIHYSNFKNVLLLDADNFPVKDPSFLFNSPEFIDKTAIFWPDYWQPIHTTFNIVRESIVWEMTGISFVDMFEQESGQIVINKRANQKALNMLMFYSSHKPNLFSKLKLAWGDKDLFRLAWLKAGQPFHMIRRPPGSLGLYDSSKQVFCGLTMVQYDMANEILFLHRNNGKLIGRRHEPKIWTHVQEFNMSASLNSYTYVHDDAGHDFKDKLCICWGLYNYKSYLKKTNNSPACTIRKTNFEKLENKIIHYSQMANAMNAK